MSSVWSPTLAWIGAVAAALALALAAPNESSVMGRWPVMQAKRADQQPLVLPQALGAERTLALVSFQRDHRALVDGWIQGLQLGHDASIRWLRVLVIHDPGDEARRREIETQLREHYADEPRVVQVFTDREAFARATGLVDTQQPQVVVLNGRGEVLARVQGRFDPVKAQTLRETLTSAWHAASALGPSRAP